ncbi:MAG TPA: hypothetical protein VFW04_10080 [Gemmatimonadaceae bacterium]|nr:hypothetical protein [Gemmatimonadaceae bacterium]
MIAQKKLPAQRVLLWLALIATVLGILEPSAMLLSIAAAGVGIAVVVRDIAGLRRGALTPMTFFSLAFAITGVANAVAVHSLIERGNQSPFDLYTAPDYVYFACELMLVGGTAILVGFYTAQRWRPWRTVGKLLPKIKARVNDRDLIVGGAAIAVLSILITNALGANRFGAVSGLIARLPDLTIFTLSRLGAVRRSRRVMMVALGLMLVVAVQAALFAYLRAEILLPILALLTGLVVGSRSLAILRRRALIPVYLLIALFGVNFATLGRIRSEAGGGEARVAAFRAASTANASDSTSDASAIVVRLSTINQLSQVGLLAVQGGFLHGATLEYLAFAFVPRFLWAAKPKIAKGAWFANRIGQAILRPDGTYNNSINMTVPGELYLNFGWGGVVVGSYLFGALLALFWSTAMFWADDSNPLGTAFGFYLLLIGIGLVADLQIIVTLVAMYLLFLAGSLVISGVRRSKPLAPMQLATADVPAAARLRT